MTIETQIVNGTTIIINEQTDPILGVTIVIALITLFGIILSSILTIKSNNLLHTEIENKFRPFFILEGFNVTIKNDTKIVLRVVLKNYGTVPARKIIVYRTKVLNEKLIELCKEKDRLNEYIEFGTLQHNGTHYFEEFIEYEKGTSNDIFFLIWFQYQYFKKHEESSVLCRINSSDLNNVKQSWFIQEDIDEARNEWNNFKSGNTSASF